MRRRKSWSTGLSGLLIGAALGALFRMAQLDLARVAGHDLGVFCTVLATLLSAGLVGALIALFLLRRHQGLAERLFACCSLVAGLCLAVATPDRTELLALSARIHGPDVTRTHYLAGVALTTALLGGSGALLLCGASAGLLRCAGLPRSGTCLLIGIGLLTAALAPLPEPGLWAAALPALAVLLFPSLRAMSWLGLLLALSILFFAPRTAPAWSVPWRLQDLVRQATGSGDSLDLSTSIDGRAWRAPTIPGWPYVGTPLESALQLVRALSGPGPLLLLGAEGSALADAARIDPGDLRTAPSELGTDENLAGVLLLPSLFAQPWPALRIAMRELTELRARLEPGRPLAVCVDLSELTFEDLALVGRLVQSKLAEPVTLLHGTHCLFLSLRGGTEQQRVFDAAGASGLLPLLSVNATRGLIQNAGDRRTTQLLFGRARTRLGSRQFRRAALNLHRLSRTADGPGFHSLSAPPPSGLSSFLTVELAIAILNDDSIGEERLLFQLGQLDPGWARRLGAERRLARARLRETLRSGLEDAPFNADIHHRLGRMLAQPGEILEGIDRLSRAIRLRPKQLDAAVDLGRAYLQAEKYGLRRPTATGPIDGCRFLFYGLPRHIRGLEEPYDQARLNVAFGRASLCIAQRAPDRSAARTEWLQRAESHFRLATTLDPLDDEALRGLARALVLADRKAEGLANVRLSIWQDPLDPEGYRLLSEVTADPDEAEVARETAARLTMP